MHIRRIPDLHFVLDESERDKKIDELLDRVKEDNAKSEK